MATHLQKGEGAPQTAPQEIGTHYIDTLNKREFISVGTSDINDWLLAAGSGASGTFTALSDVPSSYIGQAQRYVRVNAAETGLEFVIGGGGGGGDSVWGSITGTLSNQTDLQNALNLKQNFIEAGPATSVWIGNKTWYPVANLPVSDATQTALNLKIDATEKGVANGVATLDGTGIVPSSQLPSYVSDIEEYATLANFPVTGEFGTIYIALDTNYQYRWTGTQYVQLTDDTAVWGQISGSLSNQTDLQSQLDSKEPTITATNAAQYYRGDKSFQTLDKNAVGLDQVDNTSDANKPVSTLQQQALDLKEDSLGNPTVNGYVLSSTTGGSRSWIPTSSGGGGGSDNFIELLDTPSTYFSSQLQTVRVNSEATGLEFYTLTSDLVLETASNVFVTPAEKTLISTNESGISTNATNISSNTTAIGDLQTGKEDSITAGTTSQYWRGDKSFETLNILALNDVPNSYGTAGQVLVVNSSQTGMEFADQSGTFDSLADTPSDKTGSAGLVPVVNDSETDLVYEARRKVLTADLVIDVDFAGGGDFANMQEAWNFATTFASGGFGITINILNVASLTDAADLQMLADGGDYGHITLKFPATAQVVPVGLAEGVGPCWTFRNGIAPLIDGSLNQDIDLSNKFRGFFLLEGSSFVGNSVNGGPLLTIRNATLPISSNTNAAIRCESFSTMSIVAFKILGTNNIAIRVTGGSSASINHCVMLGTKFGLFVSAGTVTGNGNQDFSDGGTFQPTSTVDVSVSSGSTVFLTSSTTYTTTRPKTNIDINQLTTDGWFLDPSEPIPSGGGGGGGGGEIVNINPSTDANFTGGYITLAKTDVMMAISGNVQHASASSVSSAGQIIPSDAYPYYGSRNVYSNELDTLTSTTTSREVFVDYVGGLHFQYKDLVDGSDHSMSSSGEFTITYPYRDTSSRIEWTPAEITTDVWYDSADASTITTSGSNVTEWASKGDNFTVSQTQSTAGDFPQYGASFVRNGNNFVSFGAGHYMLSNAGGGGLVSGQAGMLFICVQPSNTSNSRRLINNNASNFFYATYQSSYSCWVNSRYNGSTVASQPIAVYGIAKGTANTGASYWENGTELSSSVSVSVFPTELNMGRNAADSYPTCEYYELISVPTNDTDTRQKIEGYLAWKWAFVSALPADHPYKNIPPLTG